MNWKKFGWMSLLFPMVLGFSLTIKAEEIDNKKPSKAEIGFKDNGEGHDLLLWFAESTFDFGQNNKTSASKLVEYPVLKPVEQPNYQEYAVVEDYRPQGSVWELSVSMSPLLYKDTMGEQYHLGCEVIFNQKNAKKFTGEDPEELQETGNFTDLEAGSGIKTIEEVHVHAGQSTESIPVMISTKERERGRFATQLENVRMRVTSETTKEAGRHFYATMTWWLDDLL